MACCKLPHDHEKVDIHHSPTQHERHARGETCSCMMHNGVPGHVLFTCEDSKKRRKVQDGRRWKTRSCSYGRSRGSACEPVTLCHVLRSETLNTLDMSSRSVRIVGATCAMPPTCNINRISPVGTKTLNFECTQPEQGRRQHITGQLMYLMSKAALPCLQTVNKTVSTVFTLFRMLLSTCLSCNYDSCYLASGCNTDSHNA